MNNPTQSAQRISQGTQGFEVSRFAAVEPAETRNDVPRWSWAATSAGGANQAVTERSRNHHYTYCLNNPLKYVAPTGQLTFYSPSTPASRLGIDTEESNGEPPTGTGTGGGGGSNPSNSYTTVSWDRVKEIFQACADKGDFKEFLDILWNMGSLDVVEKSAKAPPPRLGDNGMHIDGNSVRDGGGFWESLVVNTLNRIGFAFNYYYDNLGLGPLPPNSSTTDKFMNFAQTAAISMFIGGIKMDKNAFHRQYKEDILKTVGKQNYSPKVGNRPNINVRNGKIILEGQGPYKGKSYPTDLDPSDYLKLY